MRSTRLVPAMALAAAVALLTAACSSSPAAASGAGATPSGPDTGVSSAPAGAPDTTQASASPSPSSDPYLDQSDCTGKGTADALQAIGNWDQTYVVPLSTMTSGQQSAIDSAMKAIPSLVAQVRSDAGQSGDSHDRQVLESTADDLAQLPGWMATDTNDITQKVMDVSEEFQRDTRALSPCPTVVLP